MKIEAAEYVAQCFTYQQVKSLQQQPARLLHPLPIPEWKWETITMDFIIGLPRTMKHNDSIIVVVDKLSKEADFIPVKSTYKAVNIVDIFMKQIFRLHGIPKIVITDRDAKCTSIFWITLFKGMDTKLNFITAYHLQTDG